VLSDDEAERIGREAPRSDRAALLRWVGTLLDDRAARSALLQRQARELAHARQRLRQAFAYLDGLLQKVCDVSREAWPGKLPCSTCGAPAARVTAEQRADDGASHAIVTVHPDGVRCEARRARRVDD
jgi:hypothetical protein